MSWVGKLSREESSNFAVCLKTDKNSWFRPSKRWRKIPQAAMFAL